MNSSKGFDYIQLIIDCVGFKIIRNLCRKNRGDTVIQASPEFIEAMKQPIKRCLYQIRILYK